MSRRTILAQVRLRCQIHPANATASQKYRLLQSHVRTTLSKLIKPDIRSVPHQRHSVPTRLVPHPERSAKVLASSAAALAMAAMLGVSASSALTGTTTSSHRQDKATASPAPNSTSLQPQPSKSSDQAAHNRLLSEKAHRERTSLTPVLVLRLAQILNRTRTSRTVSSFQLGYNLKVWMETVTAWWTNPHWLL